jgi:hypothetical protein
MPLRLFQALCLAGLLAAPLVGCANVVNFTEADATTAESVAQAAGLVSDAACWSAYAQIAGALNGTSPTIGLLTTIETKRAVQATMGSPECLPITAPLLAELLKVSSPQGAALSTILGF